MKTRLNPNYLKISLLLASILYVSAFSLSFHEATYTANNDGRFYRNTGLAVKHTFLSNPGYPSKESPIDFKNRMFLPSYFLAKPEGYIIPLTYWIHFLIIGDSLALTPAVCAIPNIFYAIIGLIFAYRLGRLVIGDAAAGYMVAFSFMTFLWMSYAPRFPWFMGIASPAFGFMTWYYLVVYIEGERVKRSGFLLGLSLTLYLGISPDFPLFVFMMLLYVVYSRRLKHFIMNYGNIMPFCLSVILIIYYLTGVFHERGLYLTIFAAFFDKVVFPGTHLKSTMNYVDEIMSGLVFFAKAYGIHFILSLSGVYYILNRNAPFIKLLHIMYLWFIIGIITFLVGDINQHITYAYVLAIPMSLMVALVLHKLSRYLRISLCVIFIILQISFFCTIGTTSEFSFAIVNFKPDKRMIAVAAYLLENRADIRRKAENIANNKNYQLSREKDYANMVNIIADKKTAANLSDLIRLPVKNYSIDELTNDNKVYYLIITEREIENHPELKDDFWVNTNFAFRFKFKDSFGRQALLGILEPAGKCNDGVDELSVRQLADKYYSTYYRKSYMEKHMVRRQFM